MNSADETSIACPSCGKYVGPYEICPYCQASMNTRVSLRWIRLVSIGGSILGLILLWFGVRMKDIPLVKIGSVDAQFNMAIARFEGNVVDVSIDDRKDSFRISLDDGTGRAQLSGFSKLTHFKKILGDRFPQVGDKISAAGNISISDSFGVTLFLTSPRRMQIIERTPVTDMLLKDVHIQNVGKMAYFTGTLESIRTFPKGRSLVFTDGKTEIQATLFDSEWDEFSGETQAKLSAKGASIRFLGRIDSYRDKPQLRLIDPDKPGNLQTIGAAPASAGESPP